MTVVRAIARPLLSCIFIVQGANALRDPEPLVAKAKPVTDKLVPMLKRVAPPQVGDRIPENTKTLVRLNGAAHVAAGLALASGNGRRIGATVLAASMLPTTVAGHPFWAMEEPLERRQQRTQFLKNLGLLGGLLLAAVDTEGRPGLAWRASHGTQVAKRETARTAKLAKREARHAAKAAKREARLVAQRAKAELPFTD
jgi:uncharacterized membrane protein YphA (DoxX/SURF4 family)